MMEDAVILACPALRYELEKSLKEKNAGTIVEYLPQRLHSEPEKMHDYLQSG